MLSKKLFWPTFAVVAGVGLLVGANLLRARDAAQVLMRYGSFYWNSTKPGGIAFGGTSFLFVLRGTNGAISVMRLSKDALLVGQELFLGRTGGVPRVAFDGANYLVAWPDLTEPPTDLYGQFISPNGTAVGSLFLIDANVDAAEIGGLAFDGTNYLAVWEANGSGSNGVSTIQGRLISPTGALLGDRLHISEGTTPQKCPAATGNGSHFLVSWVGKTEGTNSWDVLGRRIRGDGSLLESVTISQIPAQQAWPLTVASDGTNWLVVWSRERGPYPVMLTNAWVPSLFGRIVGADGTCARAEFEIRWGQFGQFRPAAVFDGKNYVVAWLDRRFGAWTGQPYSYSTEFTIYAGQVDPSGERLLPEARLALAGTTPSSLVIGQSADRVLCAWDEIGVASTAGMFLTRLTNESPVLRDFKLLPTGESQFDLDCHSGTLVGIQASTNLVDWSDVEVENSFNLRAAYCPGQVKVNGPASAIGNRRFFRAFNGQGVCVENLRLIQQAKDHWTLEHNKIKTDIPINTDLFGPGRDLLNRPVCPHGGSYTIQQVDTSPTCSFAGVAGHTN